METQDSVLDVVNPIQPTSIDNHRALFSHDPEQAYMEAQRLVNVVASRCTGPGYLVNIKGRNYPKIEWWTSVSASLGLFPRVLYSNRLDRDGEIAYEAKVEVYRNGDQLIASGEAMCSNREERWKHADEFAIKSMAITRASGKCYRIPLSFLAVMAGLEVTPAEEMPAESSAIPRRDAIRTNPNEDELASEKQIAAVRSLIENDRVYPTEKRQIHEWLEDGRAKGIGLSRRKAKEILDYYFGISVLVDGKWSKSGNGKLAERR